MWERPRGLLQPLLRGTGPEGFLPQGLYGRLACVDLLLDLLQSLGLLQDVAPLTLCGALLAAGCCRELGEDLPPLRLRLPQPRTGHRDTVLPVGRIMPLLVEDDVWPFCRRSLLILELLLRLP